MNGVTHLECTASSSLSKHEGDSSLGLCDKFDRTRDNSQRQLPTDHDYAVPTREYQTDQSSPKSAQAAARSALGEKQKQRQLQKHPTDPEELTRSLHIRPTHSLTAGYARLSRLLPENACASIRRIGTIAKDHELINVLVLRIDFE